MITDDLTRGLNKLANAIETSPPPVSLLLDGATPRAAPPRRRLALVAIGGVAIIAGGAAAAATGILPEAVRERFGLTADNDEGMRADTDDADLQSIYTTPDGTRYELWFAPTDGGGGCVTVVRSSHTGDDPFVNCATSQGDVHPKFVIYGSMQVGEQLAIYGTAPGGATTVTLTFDGQSVTAPVTDNEFFTVINQPACKQATCEITASAYDSAGRLVATGI